MNVTTLSRATLIVCGIVIFVIPGAEGYDTYSVNDDSTNCRECHGDFRDSNYISPVDGQNWGNLHNIHRSTMLSGDCDVCHIGDDKLPVFLNSSTGGDGFEPVGCVGCHGVDPAPGVPNNEWWGAGLRSHHTNAGVGPDNNGDTCMSCHTDDPTPPPEDTLPSYYFTPDSNHPSKPDDPCNPAPGFSENFAGAVMGFDNDGDLLYDEDDPDCAGPTPTHTPTSTPTNTPTDTPTSTPTNSPTNTPTPTPTPTATPTQVITNTFTPTPTNTSTPTPTPDPMDLIFSDGFESGDTSAWSTGVQRFFKDLNQARNLSLDPFIKPTVLLMMFAGVALVGLPRLRERRLGRKDNR